MIETFKRTGKEEYCQKNRKGNKEQARMRGEHERLLIVRRTNKGEGKTRWDDEITNG